MLKLMKYELRKTAFSKLVLLAITAVAEIAFLIGVFWKKDNILAMGIIFLVMCTIIWCYLHWYGECKCSPS